MVVIKPDGIYITLRALYFEFENCKTLNDLVQELNKYFPSSTFDSVPKELKSLASLEKNLIYKRLFCSFYIYRSHNKLHVTPGKGDTPIFIVVSKSFQRKLDKEADKLFKQIPNYLEYDPSYHEDYVYSDANWSPALAHL